ncbi:MAG TPA: hypothetical protein VF058_11310 [Actinomycetota bacterium]
MLGVVFLTLGTGGCTREPAASPPDPSPAPTVGRDVLKLARSQGLVGCRLAVAYSAPGAESRESILEEIAGDLDADSSEPEDIADAMARELAGPNAAPEVVEAAAVGCLTGLERTLDRLER